LTVRKVLEAICLLGLSYFWHVMSSKNEYFFNVLFLKNSFIVYLELGFCYLYKILRFVCSFYVKNEIICLKKSTKLRPNTHFFFIFFLDHEMSIKVKRRSSKDRPVLAGA
jgi:hypothetical protein